MRGYWKQTQFSGRMLVLAPAEPTVLVKVQGEINIPQSGNGEGLLNKITLEGIVGRIF